MTGPNEKAAAEVRAADDARYAAMIAQDFVALDRLLADDLLYTHSTAVTDTKVQYLAALRGGKYRDKSARCEGVTVSTGRPRSSTAAVSLRSTSTGRRSRSRTRS